METKSIAGKLHISSKDIHRCLGIRSQYIDWARRRGFLVAYKVDDKDPNNAWIPLQEAVGYMVQEPGPIAENVRKNLISGRSVEDIVRDLSQKKCHG